MVHLILVGIFVAEHDRVGFVIHAGLLEVFHNGFGIGFPQFLELIDLLRIHWPCSKLFLFRGHLRTYESRSGS